MIGDSDDGFLRFAFCRVEPPCPLSQAEKWSFSSTGQEYFVDPLNISKGSEGNKSAQNNRYLFLNGKTKKSKIGSALRALE